MFILVILEPACALCTCEYFLVLQVFRLFVSNFLLFYFLFPKFTTDDCERTKGCFRSPQSCTTSDNCDFLVTYSATNSTHVEFELSGQGAWIAVGFSDDQNMVGYVDQERKLIQYRSYPLLNNDTSIQWLNL